MGPNRSQDGVATRSPTKAPWSQIPGSPLPSRASPDGHSLQTVALGAREIHVAAQRAVEVLQGCLCHLYLPLGHKNVLAREEAE